MSGTVGYAGRSAALQISTNGGSTFTTIPGVRATAAEQNPGAVDITNAGSPSGWQEMLPNGGPRGLSISVEGIVSTGAAFVAFHAHVQNQTIGLFRMDFGNGGRWQFNAVVQNFSITGNYQNAQEFRATLMSTGAVTVTAPT